MVPVPKNVANFGFADKWLCGLTRSLEFLIKIRSMYWQEPKSTFSNGWITLDKPKFFGWQNFTIL